MALDKAIEHGKEHRKQYKYKSGYAKLVDPHCRNHGACDWCKDNRLFRDRRRKSKHDVKED